MEATQFMSPSLARLRCTGVAATLATAFVVGVPLLWQRLGLRAGWADLGQRVGHPQTPDDVVTDVAAGGLVVVLTGLVGSLLLTVADVVTQERWQWLHLVSVAWCPGWGRRLVLTLCGVGMVLPATAVSAVARDREHGECRSSCAIRVDGLPMPDLPTQERAPRKHRALASVVVRPGDCLWTIAERQLRPHASDAAVSRYVDAWYAANALTIGPEPDLIFPGTRLKGPEVSP